MISKIGCLYDPRKEVPQELKSLGRNTPAQEFPD